MLFLFITNKKVLFPKIVISRKSILSNNGFSLIVPLSFAKKEVFKFYILKTRVKFCCLMGISLDHVSIILDKKRYD